MVRHVRTGQRAVIWKGKPPANPPALKPIPLPVPPPPGIGCIGVGLPGRSMPPTDKRVWATLTGGAYTGDSIIGYYCAGQCLPKPWDKWRVADVRDDFMNGFANRSHGSFPSGWCVIRNDDTGESVRLRVKQWIDLPHDAPIPATQPAE